MKTREIVGAAFGLLAAMSASATPIAATLVRFADGSVVQGGYNDCNPNQQPNPVVTVGRGDDCTLNGSPIIARFDAVSGGGWTFTGGAFPSIDGSEWTTLTGANVLSGTWSYNPGPNDPLITGFIVKHGGSLSVFGPPSGTSFLNNQVYSWSVQGQNALSHITFFDTTRKVPEPAALTLVGLGLLGIAVARRRNGG